MKKMLAVILIMLFGSVGLAYGQSAKDVYKAVKKAELKSTGTQRDVDNAIADARTEVDLFRDSKEAKKNPEFTKYIENALTALREAQFAKEITKSLGDWQKSMNKAEKELEKAKQFLK
jgi:hypothetical protein